MKYSNDRTHNKAMKIIAFINYFFFKNHAQNQQFFVTCKNRNICTKKVTAENVEHHSSINLVNNIQSNKESFYLLQRHFQERKITVCWPI